jgi:hypothetical protein
MRTDKTDKTGYVSFVGIRPRAINFNFYALKDVCGNEWLAFHHYQL